MIKQYILYIFLLFNFCLNAQTTSKTGIISKYKKEQIDSIFKKYDNLKTPGVSIGIVQGDKLIFQKAYGSANLNYNIPITEHTVFTLCSISKQFTVFGILLLVEKGLISLDDEIHTFLPELPKYKHSITLRHLATNTSGLRSNLRLLGLKGYTPHDMINQRIAYDIITKQKALNFAPGEAYDYSNSGFMLLAKVIEKVTGQTFSFYMEAHVFNPLGMKNTFVMDDYQKIVKNKASSYEMSNDKYLFSPANYSYLGASGIYTTMTDLSKWVINFNTMTIGNSTIFKQMETKGKLNNGKVSSYALGQIVQEYKGLKRIWHSGSDAGYVSYIGRFPEQKISVMLLSNNQTVAAEATALKVADLFLKPYFKHKPELKQQQKEKLAYKNLSIKELEPLLGSYINTNFLIRNIEMEGKSLFYYRADQGNRKTILNQLNANEFILGTNEHVKVVFRQDTLKVLVDEISVEEYVKYTPKSYNIKELEQFSGTFYSPELDVKYTLKTIGEELTILQPRLGRIKLSSIKEDSFTGNSWIFNSLIFERDKNQSIKGFRVSGHRVKNVYFKKE